MLSIKVHFTLIYLPHFEVFQCWKYQSGVDLIYEDWKNENQGKSYIIAKGMSKLYSETNRNTNIQIICTLCSWILMRLMSKFEYIIVIKGMEFTGTGKLGFSWNSFIFCYFFMFSIYLFYLFVYFLYRTSINSQCSVKSPAGGLVTGGLVLLALQFLTPAFYYIPAASLAAVIIMAVIKMFNYRIFIALWKVRSKSGWFYVKFIIF